MEQTYPARRAGDEATLLTARQHQRGGRRPRAGAALRRQLRSGDRLDLDEIAAHAGREPRAGPGGALQLERDGLVERAHYRGAFVAPFDADTVREAFELYGMLSAADLPPRGADPRDPRCWRTLAKLDEAPGRLPTIVGRVRAPRAGVPPGRQRRRRRPHLRALLRSFSGLVPGRGPVLH